MNQTTPLMQPTPTAAYYCQACGTSSAAPGKCPSCQSELVSVQAPSNTPVTQQSARVPGIETRQAILKVPALNKSAETTDSWHWCPDCHIASGKPGDCPTCAKPFVPAPPEGLPYGPYQPPTAGKSPVAGAVMTVIAILAVISFSVFGLWLYRQGTPASSPVASDGLVHTTAHTTVHLPELGSVNLPGTWAADPITETSLQASLNSNGGNGQVLVVERSGNTILWLASIIRSPSGTDPCTETPLGNATPTIAGHPAESSDIKSVCASGTTYQREYDMKDTGATLVLKVISPVSVTSLNTIQTALLEMPGSNSGGISI